MAPTQLLLFALLLKGVIACVQNAPSYEYGEWIDDIVIPDWLLRLEDGNTDMIILLNNYTFNCTGRIDTWFLWWIVRDTNDGCEVAFTIYVLRPPPQNNNDCSTQVVGSHREVKHFYEYHKGYLRPEPDVLTSKDDIYVKPGDFLALEINIDSRCGPYTATWMRGRIEPSMVHYRRYAEKIAISDFLCESDPYTSLNLGRGFISAHVEPIPTSMSGATNNMQTESTVDDGMLNKMAVTSSKSPDVTTTAVTHLEIASTVKPMPHLSPTSIVNVMTTPVSSQYKQQSIIVSSKSFEVTQDSASIVGKIAQDSSSVPASMVTPEGRNSSGTSLENLLFLFVVGSLVLSSVILMVCMIVVILYTCKRKNTTRHATMMERTTSNEIAAPPSRDSTEADEYYDYPILQANLQNNAAYDNPQPTVFTTYL